MSRNHHLVWAEASERWRSAPDQSGVTWGHAFGLRLAAAEPSLDPVTEALHGEHRDALWHNSVPAAFVAALAVDPAQHLRWRAFLSTVTVIAPSSPEEVTARHLQAISQAWRTCRYPFALWTDQRFSNRSFPAMLLPPAVTLAFRLLRGLDPACWLRAADQLPLPQFGREALSAEEVVDDDELLPALIEVAPALDVQQQPPSAALLFLLENVGWHVRKVHEALAGVRQRFDEKGSERAEAEARLMLFHGEEAPRWLQRCFKSLLRRPDGVEVACRWSAHLFRRVCRPDSGRAQWRAESVILPELLAVLAGHQGLEVHVLHSLWQRDQQTGAAWDRDWPLGSTDESEWSGEGGKQLRTVGLPLLLVAVDLAERRQGQVPGRMAPEAQSALWTWLLVLLQGWDPGLRLLDVDVRHTRTQEDWALQEWAMNKLGGLLLAQGKPVDALREALRGLRSQHRRALFSPHAEGMYWNWCPAPEDVILLAAQYAAGLLAIYHGESAQGQALFWVAFDEIMLRYLQVPPGRHLARFTTLRGVIVRSFALVRGVFAGEWRLAAARMLQVTKIDAWIVLRAARSMAINGLPDEEVRDLLLSQHVDLAVIEQEVQRWEPQERS